MRYVFGDYVLDTECYELRRAGTRLPLGPKAFEVLTYLLQHRGRAVTKEELLERLWPKQFVSESVLTSCILLVRKAIGDSGSVQQCIETVQGTESGLRAAGVGTPAAERRQLTVFACRVSSAPPAPSPSIPKCCSRWGLTIRPCAPRSSSGLQGTWRSPRAIGWNSRRPQSCHQAEGPGRRHSHHCHSRSR